MEAGNHLRTAVETFFAGVPYQDPMEFGGRGLIGMRSRIRSAVDPDTGQTISVSDSLFSTYNSSDDDLAAIKSSRMVYLARGEGSGQYFINYAVDEGEISVSGMAASQFTGNPNDELIAGLRIIEQHEK